MKMLSVRNWNVWQCHRNDRSQPPWIKVHRCLMRNPEWVMLSDAQRGQLICLWMLAADKNGTIPACPAMLRKLCMMDTEPDMQVFIDKGFIESDQDLTPERRQDDAMLSQEKRERREREEKREEKNLSETAAVAAPAGAGKRSRKSKFDYSPQFEAAWDAYGKDRGTKGKAAAEYDKAIREIRKRKDPPQDAHSWLLDRVREFQAAKAGVERKYVPHMENWLKNGGFDSIPSGSDEDRFMADYARQMQEFRAATGAKP